MPGRNSLYSMIVNMVSVGDLSEFCKLIFTWQAMSLNPERLQGGYSLLFVVSLSCHILLINLATTTKILG